MTPTPFHKEVWRYARWQAGNVRARMKARMQTRSAYSGAGMNRLLLDWIAQSRSADDEMRGDVRRLRARARELGRNNPYAKRYFRLLVNNVVGPAGIKLQAKVRKNGELDRATNTQIEAAWTEWATDPVTLDGKLNLRRLELLLLRTLSCEGEAFVRIWRGVKTNRFGIALQTIDADLIDERFNRDASAGRNEIRMGIEVDDVGRPVAYHVWDKPTTAAIGGVRRRYVVPASEMIHIYTPDRVNQTRGVTWLASILVPAHMLDGYEESEAVASRVSSAKMGFLQKSNPEIGGSLGTTAKTPAKMQANPGSIEILDDGYEFKEWAPNHPTSQFAAFIKQMLRKIASGLSVFSNVLANDAEGVSYSSMRSFTQIERDDWRQTQEDLIDMWRRPLYREWLSLALLTGALVLPTRNPDHYMAVRHRPRGWTWIDPDKEAKGAVLSIENGLTTRTAILAGQGLDIEDVFAELAEEERLASSYGLSISRSAPAEAPVTMSEVEEIVGGNGEDRDADVDELVERLRSTLKLRLSRPSVS